MEISRNSIYGIPDVELNFGDEYAISSMEGNLDFQYEQFAIKEDSGKTNVNPILNDTLIGGVT